MVSLDLSREIDRLLELEVLRVHLLTATPVDALSKRLVGFRGTEIAARIAAKLASQFDFRHDIACETSDRHEGLGFSRAAIGKHMEDAVAHELAKALACLEAVPMKLPTPRRVHRIEVLDAMIID